MTTSIQTKNVKLFNELNNIDFYQILSIKDIQVLGNKGKRIEYISEGQKANKEFFNKTTQEIIKWFNTKKDITNFFNS
jgi:hypothetical protein